MYTIVVDVFDQAVGTVITALEGLGELDSTLFVVTSPTGTASTSFSVPNDVSFVGVALYHQWAVLDAVNSLGIVVSNGGRALAGN